GVPIACQGGASLCRDGEALPAQGPDARRVRMHRQRFGGGRTLRLVNSLGAVERDLGFAVGDQLSDTCFGRFAVRLPVQSRRRGAVEMWLAMLEFLRHAVPARAFLSGVFLNYHRTPFLSRVHESHESRTRKPLEAW